MPKYRIHQNSLIDDRYIDVTASAVEITTSARHIPGPHWEPIDDEAKALCKKHGVKFTGHVPDPTDKLSLVLQDTLSHQSVDSEALGRSIAAGLAPAIKELAKAAQAVA